jgi:hypothetical protein
VPIVGSAAASVKLRELKSRYFWFTTATMPDLNMKPETVRLKAGAVIMATGWNPYDATKMDILGFGKARNVITNMMMERDIHFVRCGMQNINKNRILGFIAHIREKY